MTFNINNPVAKIFITGMQGDTCATRIGMAQTYRDGILNPRATLYTIAEGTGTAKTIFKNVIKINASGTIEQKQNALLFYKKFKQIIDEILKPTHQLVLSAKKDLMASYKEIYPSKKTQKFTKFILIKEQFPALKNFKFLARFMPV